MKCAVLINAFKKPKNTFYQAERLKSEFNGLNVECDVINDGYLSVDSLLKYDFAVYLDKDKYLVVFQKKFLKLQGIK